MQSTETNGTIHMGRSIKRFREMLGIKQEALALELGDDWNQKKISLTEPKEIIDDGLLEEISKVLKVPVEAIKKFDEEKAVNFIANTFNQSGLFNRDCTLNFNPVDKIVELYEKMLKDKEMMVEELRELIKSK